MLGTASIPNPSLMTIDLGNVTMNLAVDKKPLGTSFLPNLILKPGDNNVTMQGRVDQVTVLELITTKYRNAVLPMEITGNSSVGSKTGERLAYFEEAMRENVVKLDLDVGEALREFGLVLPGGMARSVYARAG
jgi:hypothetical protein